MSEVDHWSHQQFSDEEIIAIVQEAARAERFVAAHAEGQGRDHGCSAVRGADDRTWR